MSQRPEAWALGLMPGPVSGPLCAWSWGGSGTYLQNQLPGRRGHEDAVTPRGAPSVHVLPALAGVLAVRVAGGTERHPVSHRLQPHLQPSSVSPGEGPVGCPCMWNGRCYAGKECTYRSFQNTGQTYNFSPHWNLSCNGILGKAIPLQKRSPLFNCGFSSVGGLHGENPAVAPQPAQTQACLLPHLHPRDQRPSPCPPGAPQTPLTPLGAGARRGHSARPHTRSTAAQAAGPSPW